MSELIVGELAKPHEHDQKISVIDRVQTRDVHEVIGVNRAVGGQGVADSHIEAVIPGENPR
jgi:hypothetical protein